MSLSDLTWRPPLVAATPARALVADLVALTKPRIVELLVVTGVAATVVAAGGWPGAGPLAAVIIGGGMAGAGAGSINCALEGDLDRKMPRTSQRPVAAGRLSAGVALTQGIVLNLAAFTLIEMLTNPLAASTATNAGWRKSLSSTRVPTRRVVVARAAAARAGPKANWPPMEVRSQSSTIHCRVCLPTRIFHGAKSP